MKYSLFSNKIKLWVFIINIAVLFCVGSLHLRYQFQQLEDDFYNKTSHLIENDFSNKISTTKGILTSLVSYYQSSHTQSSSAFANFSKDLLSNYPFLTTIAFSRLIHHDERKSFEESMADDGFYNFSITEYNRERNQFTPSPTYSLYAPIIRIEPSNFNNTKYYGYDIFNDPSFQKVFESATQDAGIAIKHLRPEGLETPPSYFLMKATYLGESIPKTKKERLKKVNGFYIINIDIYTLLETLTQEFPNFLISISKQPVLFESIKFSNDGALLTLKSSINIKELGDSFLHIRKPLYLKDFNIVTPFLLVFLVFAIQVLFVLIWKKDRFVKQELDYQAHHDNLTGLPNRMLLRDRLNLAIKRRNDRDIQQNIALLIVDLDHFKKINDSYGHQMGDSVILDVAKRFKAVIRETDTICRLGGDEFIILIDKINNSQDVIYIIQKLMACLEEPFPYKFQKVYVNASIGIAVHPYDGENVDDLLKNADAAMYRAKNDGRNTYSFYTEEMTSLAIERLTLETNLRQAIAEDDFIIHYQPQVDSNSDTLIGMEALVRWEKEGKIVPPNHFIPLAEETGLIIALDTLVMEKAIQQVTQWHKKGLNPGVLSLNLSTKQLQHPDFSKFIQKLLEKYDCRPEWVELEITERYLIDNPNVAIDILKNIAKSGIKFAIDDFGTGYSSLAYLKKLPLNKLKIDRSFIMDLPFDDEDVAITSTIIALATNLNLDVIAEGVETLEQKQFLLTHGCSKIQGYFYSKPLPASKMETLLKNPYF